MLSLVFRNTEKDKHKLKHKEDIDKKERTSKIMKVSKKIRHRKEKLLA